MASIIPGYNYDIFISYRQKDNKHDGWVTEFVDNLKGELEATFKEDISVYFDINPHDGLLETHDVDESLKDKLKCLIFIPIISRTYCDPKSFAWEHEFKAFVNLASADQFGLKIRLPGGNVTNRVLPVQIHELEAEDQKLVEDVISGHLRGIEFIYKEGGIDKPLSSSDDEKRNLNNTKYRIQMIKVAHAIREIVSGLKANQDYRIKQKTSIPPEEVLAETEKSSRTEGGVEKLITKKSLIIALSLLLFFAGVITIYKVVSGGKQSENVSKQDKSIAVLPFVNDSPDKENEYFCNGMMEDILNNLVKIKELDVKSRTDVEGYRGVKKSRKEIAKELGVSYLIEGSVRKQGNQFRLMVQLIDAETGFHKWSQPYEGEALDIFKVQAAVAKKVADELKVVLSSDEKNEVEKIPTSNIEAYEYFILAREEATKYWRSYDLNNIKKSQELIDKALKLDPEFEEAISWKGWNFMALGQYDSARIYANRLLSIKQYSFDAYKLLGDIYRFTDDPVPAIENYKNALRYSGNQKQKNIEQLNLWIGWTCCSYLNNYKEGFSYLQKCDSTDYVYWSDLGVIFSSIGDFERAEKYCKISVEIDTAPIAIGVYTRTLHMQSKYDEALNILNKYCKEGTGEHICTASRLYTHIFKKDFKNALIDLDALYKFSNQLTTFDSLGIAFLYKNTGREKEASVIIQNSLNSFKKQSITNKGAMPYLFSSFLYGMIGDKVKSLKMLSKAVDIGMVAWGLNNYPEIVPFYGNIRNDHEFKAIIKRMKDKAEKSRAEVDEMRKRGEIDL